MLKEAKGTKRYTPVSGLSLRFKRLPQGMSNSSATFMEQMTSALHDISNNTAVYIQKGDKLPINVCITAKGGAARLRGQVKSRLECNGDTYGHLV